MTYEIETTTITPELAHEWLAMPAEHQRRITASYVQRLAEDMTRGLFVSSPQPFILDTSGALLDGQHRAAAVALSGVPLESAVVVRGVDPQMFGQLDIGLRRTAAQFVASRHSSLVAAAARWTILYSQDDQILDSIKAFSRMSIAQAVAEVEHRPLLELLAGQVSLVSKATHINAAGLLAVTTLGAASAGDRIDDWLDGLNTGANLEVGDPRLTLRNTFSATYRQLNMSPNRRRMFVYIVKCWNAFVMDDELKMLKFRPNKPGGSRTGENVPRVIGS